MSSRVSNSGKTRSSRGSRRQDTGIIVAPAKAHEFEDGRVHASEDTIKDHTIADKEAELTHIYEGHDALVREAFHMEHFRMMLSYDPVEAKQDNSSVFQNYKANHDLLETANTSVPGPSRRTRRADSERKSLVLPESIDISPTTSISASISSNRKGKALNNHVSRSEATKLVKSSVSPRTDPYSTPARSSKADGKRRIINDTQNTQSLSSTRTLRGRKKYENDAESESGAGGLADANASMNLASTITRVHSNPDGISVSSRKRPSRILLRVPTRPTVNSLPSESVSVNECSPIRSPRKVTLRVSRSTNEISSQISALPRSPEGSQPQWIGSIKQSQSALPLSNGSPQTRTPALYDHIPAKRKIVCTDDEQHSDLPSTQPSYKPLLPMQPLPPPIKRIKLIVRPPAPLISSPLQRPLPPKHNYSLSHFLSSYTTDGFEEVPPGLLAERALNRANFLERVQHLQEEGRLFNDPSVLELTPMEVANKRRKSSDIWHHCIEDAAAYLESKNKEPSGVEITGHISKAIQAYWDVQIAKREKMKAQEERRIRALAKATIKLVTAEWKKAVFHLREQERLKLEAEEARRGRAHLDAILDQSGQILETQHGDLMRTDRSRSHSRGSSVSDWTERGDGDEEEEEEEQSKLMDVSIIGDEDEEVSFEDSFSRDQSEPSTDEGDQPTLLDLLIDEDLRGREEFNTPSFPQSSDDLSRRSFPLVDSSVPLTEDFSDQPRDFLSVNMHEDIPLNHGTRTSIDLDQSLNDGTSSPSTVDVVTPFNDFEDDRLKVVEVEKSNPVMAIASLQENEPMLSAKENPSGPILEEPDIDTAIVPSRPPVTTDPNYLTAEPLYDYGDSSEHSSPQAQEENQQDGVPVYLKPYAVTHVDWNPDNKISPPVLLRGVLRPYQFAGLEWLASLHSNNLNGILADEMGLGKTIQTISLLAHLACDRGIWGPHLIIVPTSVLLNWEMEFKKFLPGFKILCYHGTTKRRKELRQGWNNKYHFNVCITSYTIASRDAFILKRKNWYYMVLDEAHMIKNFRSQRWNTLLLFRSFRRLLLTGTPLQNNLTELWALLQFLMSGAKFANLKEFGEWFSNPLEKAIEMGNFHDHETKQRVSKLHTVLRPYLLRRLKRDVEKELPNKYEHLVLCSLSKRQRFLYDEFMARAHTRDALQSGGYQKIANVLMQLRKVCNHPDLFEIRPIVTSFVMDRSAVADFQIKELLIRRRLLDNESEELDLNLLGLCFINLQNTSIFTTLDTRAEAASAMLTQLCENPGPAPPKDVRNIKGFQKYAEWQRRASLVARWSHTAYLNRLRYSRSPIYSSEAISLVRSIYNPIMPLCHINTRTATYVDRVLPSVHKVILTYEERATKMADVIDRFAFITPSVIARDITKIALAGLSPSALDNVPLTFDEVVHRSVVKLSIAFPSPSLLQYDCGKLQRLTTLLREKKAGGHRVLLFTQMTRILDILEIYLNLHGYLYLRLDGATSIEDRQYVTERFNKDERIFCFIASSRSGGVGINLTGADTVIFYDSDFNPQMDRQCEDRAHRIGQIRDVHIYRFVSEHTVEEAMLLKANQKRSLDDMVIQKGEFDWRSIFKFDSDGDTAVDRSQRRVDSSLLTKALGEFEDSDDALAARMAEREEVDLEGADEADFGLGAVGGDAKENTYRRWSDNSPIDGERDGDDEDEDEAGGTTVEHMLAFINHDPEFFAEWRL